MTSADQKGRAFAAFLLLAAFTYVPILVHHFLGPLPYVSYEIIGRLIPKISWDFERMGRLYGPEAAEYFRTYFITNVVIYTFWLFVLIGVFLVFMARGYSIRELMVTHRSPLYGTSREFVLPFLLWLVIFVPVLVLPTWIAPPGYGGLYNMRPGMRSELFISAAFNLLTVFAAFMIVAVIEKGTRHDES